MTIVDDSVDGDSIAVTWCLLCSSGGVSDRLDIPVARVFAGEHLVELREQ